MRLTWDEAKRQKTLSERGLDFAEAELILSADDRMSWQDARRDYGEPRYLTAGRLRGRFLVITWTPRDEGVRVISMRYGHGKEEERYRKHLGGSG